MWDEKFDWDERKNQINIKKHGISFEEAQTVFDDDDAILIADDKHSEDEERFIIIGESELSRLLVVCHCCRESETVVRLISARKANKKETDLYCGGVL
ncbi:MAG: BrnT family toxin [Oscillospiraceae bacterium]|nr:BrnT family toxin [Oscillospiraceae bacterium]